MADNLSKEQRSHCMSRIRSRNTKAELILRSLFKGRHLRFHPNIFGNPDFGSKKGKIAVFLDGCFWHKCPKCYRQPKSRKAYWIGKAIKNRKRDSAVNRRLSKDGFRVLRFWEHDILCDPLKCANRIMSKA